MRFKNFKHGVYSSKEDAFIRKNAGKLWCTQIAKKLGRDAKSIRYRANRIGVNTEKLSHKFDHLIGQTLGSYKITGFGPPIPYRRRNGSIQNIKTLQCIYTPSGDMTIKPASTVLLGRNKGLCRPKRSGTISDDGYCIRKVNGKSILEHRLVMEQHLGRKLHRDEHVHHKNLHRTDNDLKNLELRHKGHGAGHTIKECVDYLRNVGCKVVVPVKLKKVSG